MEISGLFWVLPNEPAAALLNYQPPPISAFGYANRVLLDDQSAWH
jgi:hypothetical protein